MELAGIEKHRYCNRNERAEWITQYRSSGLRPAQFAEQHGLKLGTLRRIQKEGPGSSPGSETSGFQELLLPSVAAAGPWVAEVQLRCSGHAFMDRVVAKDGAPVMQSLSIATRIFVALEPVDMRQNFNGLYARVQSVLQQDPLSGHLIVFTNRSRTVWIWVVRITRLKLPGDAGCGRIFLLGVIHGEPTGNSRISDNYEDR